MTRADLRDLIGAVWSCKSGENKFYLHIKRGFFGVDARANFGNFLARLRGGLISEPAPLGKPGTTIRC
jgi:hypothetical protein